MHIWQRCHALDQVSIEFATPTDVGFVVYYHFSTLTSTRKVRNEDFSLHLNLIDLFVKNVFKKISTQQLGR